MRFFEMVLLILVAASPLFILLIKNRKVKQLLLFLSVLIGILSIAFEGYRTPMTLAYILSAVMLLIGLTGRYIKQGRVKKVFTVIGVILFIPVMIITAALPMLLPVTKMTAPNGKYSVGTSYMLFTDSSRSGIISETDKARQIAIQVWYPSDHVAGRKAQNYFRSPQLATLMAKQLRMPDIFGQLASVKTHSYVDAPLTLKGKKLPIIIFSGGFSSFNGQNTIQMEELASNGYVVFSVSHIYEDFGTIFPDGKVITCNSTHVSEFLNEALTIGNQYKGDKMTAKFIKYWIKQSKICNDDLRIWGDDISFAADEIEKLDSGETKSIFAGRLDMASMGVFGHSFGGAAAGQACLNDKRFKCFINMDGTAFGDTHDTIINQPFMLMCNDTDKDMVPAGYSPEQKKYSIICINGARHQNFTDFSELLPTFKYLGVLGSINGERFESIMNSYVLAFFDKHLKGKTDTLMDQKSSIYSEVSIKYK